MKNIPVKEYKPPGATILVGGGVRAASSRPGTVLLMFDLDAYLARIGFAPDVDDQLAYPSRGIT
jgi:hypothetical protein